MASILRHLWLCGWCAINLARAKVQTGRISLGGVYKGNRWKYASKFGYGLGSGSYSFRVQLHSPKSIVETTHIHLNVFLDEDWENVEAREDLCTRHDLARENQDLVVDSAGEWGQWVNGSLHQTVRPHIWYFAVHDCDNALQNFTHRLKFEFRANQENASEFSIEMQHMLSINLFGLFGFSLFGYVFVTKARAFFKSSYVHPIVWSLSAAIAFQYLAQFCHTWHLWRYGGDGQGLKGLEVLSEIMFMLSQVIQTSLLILIALGYTLLQSNIGELDLMIPMCFMVAVIHIMLVGFGKIQDDASYKYHENEGGVGWVLLVMRLLLYVWFLWAVRSTAAEGGMRLQQFCRQFQAAGTVYFLAYPVIFLVTKQFAPYLQHGIMASSLMLMQMGSNFWLSALFLRKSDYWKVSTLNSSELPGGARVGLDKEE